MRELAAGVSAPWLALREPADARARAVELAALLRSALRLSSPTAPAVHRPAAGRRPLVIHDLGAGTGSMLRWLAPRLPGPQAWVLHDRDRGLLARAGIGRVRSAEGLAVAVTTRCGDVTRLGPQDLAGADVVTASALLDLLTAEEVEGLAAACLAPGRPVLLTLTVTGSAELEPAEALDLVFAEAFGRHQRRAADGGSRRLLGPDAAQWAAASFTRLGSATVRSRPAPWLLGPGEHRLMKHWLDGWVSAACEAEPALTAVARDYVGRRRRQGEEGRLRVRVYHDDLLVLP